MSRNWRWRGAAVALAVCAASACVPNDPSAREEAERLKAELAAKERESAEVRNLVSAKDAEVEAMRGQLAEMRAQLEEAAKMQVPTAEEIEQKLSLETVRLRREAEEKLPGYKIQEVTLGSVNIPSPDYPFSCEVAMTLEDPAGKVGQLFWRGRGDLQGNWTYEPIAKLSTTRPSTPAREPGPVAANRPAEPAQPAQPAQPARPVHDPLVSRKNESGAMPAGKTIIIDLNKLQPLNIPPQ